MQGILYSIILYPIFYILSAYVANGAPVLFGGGAPLDRNKKLNGKPIFGRHKTANGFTAGVASGILIGFIESFFVPYMFAIGIYLSLGALTGDLAGSFFKRRLGIREGKSNIVLDEYFFLFFALLFAFPSGNLPSLYGIIFLIILTGVLHKFTNYAAYRLGLKKVPW